MHCSALTLLSVVGTILNIVFTMASGDGSTLPGLSNLSAAQIIYQNVGYPGFMVIWGFVLFTTQAVVIVVRGRRRWRG